MGNGSNQMKTSSEKFRRKNTQISRDAKKLERKNIEKKSEKTNHENGMDPASPALSCRPPREKVKIMKTKHRETREKEREKICVPTNATYPWGRTIILQKREDGRKSGIRIGEFR